MLRGPFRRVLENTRNGADPTLLPVGPKVVPFWGSYLEFYKVIPKRNYFGAYGYFTSY